MLLLVPVPDCLVIVTVAPPVVSALPLASLAVTVSTCVKLPLAVMEALVGVRADCVASAAPGVPVAVNVTGLPVREPEVAVKVLLPAVVPRVQVPALARP